MATHRSRRSRSCWLRASGIASLLATLSIAPPAQADPAQVNKLFSVPRCSSKQLCWAPNFNRMDVPEMVLTGAAASLALATNIIHPLNTGWSGGILFDDQVRSTLRLSTLDSQFEARSGSDLGLALITTFPIVVDSLLVAYWYRGSADVALQMVLIDAEAFAITAAIEGTSNFVSGRARPYSADCGTGVPNNTADCAADTRYRSFFSGHSAVSFTAAALICSHHEALRLFDGPADHVTCATGFLAAATIGTLRIMGDAHYFSDVFIGAVVGTTVGLTLPLLHHYKLGSSGSAASPVHLSLVPGFGTAQLVGTF